jgi:hypothetical protein
MVRNAPTRSAISVDRNWLSIVPFRSARCLGYLDI